MSGKEKTKHELESENFTLRRKLRYAQARNVLLEGERDAARLVVTNKNWEEALAEMRRDIGLEGRRNKYPNSDMNRRKDSPN